VRDPGRLRDRRGPAALICVDTYGTGAIDSDTKLEKIVREVFDMTPAGIIKALDLKHPKKNGWSFQETAAYGHFGRDIFPWEKTDKVKELKASAASISRARSNIDAAGPSGSAALQGAPAHVGRAFFMSSAN
jgi:hypothetical protein